MTAMVTVRERSEAAFEGMIDPGFIERSATRLRDGALVWSPDAPIHCRAWRSASWFRADSVPETDEEAASPEWGRRFPSARPPAKAAVWRLLPVQWRRAAFHRPTKWEDMHEP